MTMGGRAGVFPYPSPYPYSLHPLPSPPAHPPLSEHTLANDHNHIEILGARVHNLQNIDVTLPRHQLSVITGLSGSGKSSLAFDTLYAEGQRRYIETFSAYARNFLDHIERPDVDKISGLSPVISIEQKTTNRNPRSTVGTVTEVYDFLRLLYARAATPYSYRTGRAMVRYTEDQVLDLVIQRYDGQRIMLLAPVVRNRKGHYRELFDTLRKKGFLNVRIDGEMKSLEMGMKVDRYKNHNIEVVVDKLAVREKDRQRLRQSIALTMIQGDGLMMVCCKTDEGLTEPDFFSKHLMDAESGLSYHEPAPHNFSFNSPRGACPQCHGMGTVNIVDRSKAMEPRLSVRKGGFIPLGTMQRTPVFMGIGAVLQKYGFDIDTPVGELPDEVLDELFDGTNDELPVPKAVNPFARPMTTTFDGITRYVVSMADDDLLPAAARRWAEEFVTETTCPLCGGTRLNAEALAYRLDGKNIAQLAAMELSDLYRWLDGIEERLPERQAAIAREILKEIRTRLRFLLDVGLNYLSLDRSTMSLSGGESQRIRLATQIGSQLVNVLYILDEPSIGLHQRDNVRLIRSLKALRDLGNTVVVVEHDRDMMMAADYVVDIGPLAGRRGGKVVFQGTPEAMAQANTLTADYLNGRRDIALPAQRRSGNGHSLVISGAKGNNLKDVTMTLPLGTMVCVTGVSGSGKSTLINDTLYPILAQRFYHALQAPLPYDSISGIEHIDKVVGVDQSPIGRTPRSNPATYTGVFTDIRNLFVSLPEAKMRGYKPGRFSFNVSGGRCETCKGNGYKAIEMNFMPDVYVPCECCHGKRYNRETLEVRYKGKSIADVLDMTINQAVEFFANVPAILRKIVALQEVGLGYIRLGQSSTTLSGGESQRVKLATELSKRDTGRTLYILDEPTTGLHFEDIRVLLGVLNRLVDKGNTVVVIEHNLDVIKAADHIIDLGPDGGAAGGQIVATGTPEEVAAAGIGPTAPFLKEELERSRRVQSLQPASPEAYTTEADATVPTKRAKKSKKPAAEDTALKKKSTKKKKES